MRVNSGFTLIEIVVALLIVALLATLAIPSYQNAVIKSKRAEGRAALMRLMQQQERYYSVHTTYLPFSATSGDEHERQFSWYSGTSEQSSSYEISAEACDSSGIRHCIRLMARPGTDRVDASYRDFVCGTLTLDSRGDKSAAANDCW
ncbi:type IV pilin protein [Herminiimonas glaciei]|uniref:Type IV pilin protein n=1 Tax=Herminiimonas glaciei TaxID=523788 RepID=A0ABW2I727_9BURK